jgi:hypothetical protein
MAGNVMAKWMAALSIAAATTAGIYAVAATTATSISATFMTAETASHTRLKDFADEVRRIAAQHDAERAKCERFSKTKKIECRTALRAEEKRSVAAVARR